MISSICQSPIKYRNTPKTSGKEYSVDDDLRNLNEMKLIYIAIEQVPVRGHFIIII